MSRALSVMAVACFRSLVLVCALARVHVSTWGFVARSMVNCCFLTECTCGLGWTTCVTVRIRRPAVWLVIKTSSCMSFVMVCRNCVVSVGTSAFCCWCYRKLHENLRWICFFRRAKQVIYDGRELPTQYFVSKVQFERKRVRNAVFLQTSHLNRVKFLQTGFS